MQGGKESKAENHACINDFELINVFIVVVSNLRLSGLSLNFVCSHSIGLGLLTFNKYIQIISDSELHKRTILVI